jgi:hypothetical protein
VLAVGEEESKMLSARLFAALAILQFGPLKADSRMVAKSNREDQGTKAFVEK